MVALATVLPASPATPAPVAPAAPTVEQLARRIQKLEVKAAMAGERYNRTREEIISARVRLIAARNRVAAQQQRVERARESLGLLAAEVYRRGHFSGLDLAFSEDPEALLAQAGLVTSMATRRSDLVEKLELAERQLVEDADRVVAEEEALREGRRRLAEYRREVLRQLTRTQAELGSLSYRDRMMLQRASRDRDRRAILDALRQPPEGGTGSAGRTGGIGVSCTGVPVVAPSRRAAAVLRFACAQLGKPYRWGASGPRNWDCSGLTRMAWAQAGVSLPHSSALQYSYGTRVSRQDLLPGDLVFFYSPISHVGIYLGRGLVLHAPSTGDLVKISGIFDSYVGAVRL